MSEVVSREVHQYCKVRTVTSVQRKLCLLAPGLDFAIRLGNSVLNLPDRHENFGGDSNYIKDSYFM